MWKQPYYRRFRRGSKVFPALCVMLALLCFVSPCFAQESPSTTSASWADFDALLTSLRQEIESLNSQIIEAQNSLTLSQSELATLKARLVEREQLLKKYADSLTLSTQSLTTSEARRKSSERLNAILIVAEIVSLIGLGFAVAR